MNPLAQDALDLVGVILLSGVLLIVGGALVWVGRKLLDISANFYDRPRFKRRRP